MNDNRPDSIHAVKDYDAYMADGQMLAARLSALPPEARCYISGVLRGMEISHALRPSTA